LLSEKKEKFERFNTVARMKLKMQEDELQRTLFSKRKLPSSFDSILATPSKELKLDETVTDSDNNILSTTWSNQQNERLKSLKGCERKKSPDQNLEV
jgi:sialic acid synthase SpsE